MAQVAKKPQFGDRATMVVGQEHSNAVDEYQQEVCQ
jgi:hypothetical protein